MRKAPLFLYPILKNFVVIFMVKANRKSQGDMYDE